MTHMMHQGPDDRPNMELGFQEHFWCNGGTAEQGCNEHNPLDMQYRCQISLFVLFLFWYFHGAISHLEMFLFHPFSHSPRYFRRCFLQWRLLSFWFDLSQTLPPVQKPFQPYPMPIIVKQHNFKTEASTCSIPWVFSPQIWLFALFSSIVASHSNSLLGGNSYLKWCGKKHFWKALLQHYLQWIFNKMLRFGPLLITFALFKTCSEKIWLEVPPPVTCFALWTTSRGTRPSSRLSPSLDPSIRFGEPSLPTFSLSFLDGPPGCDENLYFSS